MFDNSEEQSFAPTTTAGVRVGQSCLHAISEILNFMSVCQKIRDIKQFLPKKGEMKQMSDDADVKNVIKFFQPSHSSTGFPTPTTC